MNNCSPIPPAQHGLPLDDSCANLADASVSALSFNAEHKPPTCPHCGSLLSITTWTCVRGKFCPGEKRSRAKAAQSPGPTPANAVDAIRALGSGAREAIHDPVTFNAALQMNTADRVRGNVPRPAALATHGAVRAIQETLSTAN